MTQRPPLPCPWPAGQDPARPRLTGSGSWTARHPAGPENNNSDIWRLFLELIRAHIENNSPAFTLLTGSGSWTAHHPAGPENNDSDICRLFLELKRAHIESPSPAFPLLTGSGIIQQVLKTITVTSGVYF